jgi:hypothetical protein
MLYFLCTKNYTDGMDGYTSGHKLPTGCRYAKRIGSSRSSEMLPRQMARIFCTQFPYTPLSHSLHYQVKWSVARNAAAEADSIPVEWTRCDSVCQYPRLDGKSNDSVAYWTPVYLRHEMSGIKRNADWGSRALTGRIPKCRQTILVFFC